MSYIETSGRSPVHDRRAFEKIKPSRSGYRKSERKTKTLQCETRSTRRIGQHQKRSEQVISKIAEDQIYTSQQEAPQSKEQQQHQQPHRNGWHTSTTTAISGVIQQKSKPFSPVVHLENGNTEDAPKASTTTTPNQYGNPLAGNAPSSFSIKNRTMIATHGSGGKLEHCNSHVAPQDEGRRSTEASIPSHVVGFHQFFLRYIQVHPRQDYQLMDNILYVELLCHLQSIMLEIVPHSKFRLHGALISGVQTRLSPLELSWDITEAEGDPLKQLATMLRRQQPTPLKYLFRVQSLVAYRSLLVQDLVSNTSCEISVNNSWGVMLAEALHYYCRFHPVLACAARCLFHWATTKGLTYPTPATTTGGDPPSYEVAPQSSTGNMPDSTIRRHTSHASLSAIAILYIRYLIERFKFSCTSDILLGGAMSWTPPPALSRGTTGLAVEDILLGFFAFYRDVDFAHSVICIRSGDSSQFRKREARRSRLSSLEVDHAPILTIQDPFTARNLTACWERDERIRFLTELQDAPWSSTSVAAALSYDDCADTTVLMDNPVMFELHLQENDQAISSWLLNLFDRAPTLPNFESLLAQQQRFEPMSPCQTWELPQEAVHSLKSHTTSVPLVMGTKPMTAFPSREELLLEIEGLHVMQQILAERVRFLRNDVWWLERHANGPASSSASCVSLKRPEVAFRQPSRQRLTSLNALPASVMMYGPHPGGGGGGGGSGSFRSVDSGSPLMDTMCGRQPQQHLQQQRTVAACPPELCVDVVAGADAADGIRFSRDSSLSSETPSGCFDGARAKTNFPGCLDTRVRLTKEKADLSETSCGNKDIAKSLSPPQIVHKQQQDSSRNFLCTTTNQKEQDQSRNPCCTTGSQETSVMLAVLERLTAALATPSPWQQRAAEEPLVSGTCHDTDMSTTLVSHEPPSWQQIVLQPEVALNSQDVALKRLGSSPFYVSHTAGVSVHREKAGSSWTFHLDPTEQQQQEPHMSETRQELVATDLLVAVKPPMKLQRPLADTDTLNVQLHALNCTTPTSLHIEAGVARWRPTAGATTLITMSSSEQAVMLLEDIVTRPIELYSSSRPHADLCVHAATGRVMQVTQDGRTEICNERPESQQLFIAVLRIAYDSKQLIELLLNSNLECD